MAPMARSSSSYTASSAAIPCRKTPVLAGHLVARSNCNLRHGDNGKRAAKPIEDGMKIGSGLWAGFRRAALRIRAFDGAVRFAVSPCRPPIQVDVASRSLVFHHGRAAPFMQATANQAKSANLDLWWTCRPS